jgi:hypothetical protein
VLVAEYNINPYQPTPSTPTNNNQQKPTPSTPTNTINTNTNNTNKKHIPYTAKPDLNYTVLIHSVAPLQCNNAPTQCQNAP